MIWRRDQQSLGVCDAVEVGRLTAGTGRSSVLLAVYHNLNWLWLTGIMGAHLIQASFTGLCPVVAALKKMGLPTKAGFA